MCKFIVILHCLNIESNKPTTYYVEVYDAFVLFFRACLDACFIDEESNGVALLVYYRNIVSVFD